mgnify:CR=1 FL=1
MDGPYQQALDFIKCDNDYKLAKSKMLQLKRFELGDQEINLTVKYTDREEKMKESIRAENSRRDYINGMVYLLRAFC